MANKLRLGDVIRKNLPGRTRGLVIGGSTSVGSDRFEKPLFELRSGGFQCLTATTLPTPWVEPSCVDDIAKMATRTGVDFIVAVGGGTTIDTAKAVASVVGLRKPCASWMSSQPRSPPPLPLIMVPTTVVGGLAAGSARCNINMPDEQLLTSLKVSKPETLSLHLDSSLLVPGKTNKDECSAINCLLAAAIDLVLVRSKIEQDEDGNFGPDDQVGKQVTQRLASLLVKLQLFMENLRRTQLDRPPPPVGSPLTASPLILTQQERTTLLDISVEMGSLSNHHYFDSSPFANIARALHVSHFNQVGYADLVSSIAHDGFSTISNERKVGEEQGLLGEELATMIYQQAGSESASLNWLTEGDDELLRWLYQDMINLREGKVEIDDIALLAKHKARVFQVVSKTASPSALLESVASSFHVSEPLCSRGFSFSDVWPNQLNGVQNAQEHFTKWLTPLGDPYA